jgi:hypothetical protein
LIKAVLCVLSTEVHILISGDGDGRAFGLYLKIQHTGEILSTNLYTA